jgi:hypothetical protein
MSSFVIELADHAWSSFLVALGTTGLGFFVSNIVLFVATLVVTHLVILARGGWPAMKGHAAKENIKLGILIYVLVLLTVFLPIYGYQLFYVIPNGIRADANHQLQPAPIPTPAPKPPEFAYFPFFPRRLTISFTPMDFEYIPKGGENFSADFVADHKMYSFVIANGTRSTFENIDLRCDFPYSVDDRYSTIPQPVALIPLANLIGRISINGSGISFNGHIVYRVYSLKIKRLLPGKSVAMKLVLDSFTSHPSGGNNTNIPKYYIDGTFVYRIRNRVIKEGYYAPFEVVADKIFDLGQERPRPKLLDGTIDMMTFVP